MKTALKTVLITGASSGIGLELAKIFAANNCNLVLVARNKSAMDELAKELSEKFKVKVKVIVKDLSDKNAPMEIYSELENEKIETDEVILEDFFYRDDIGKIRIFARSENESSESDGRDSFENEFSFDRILDSDDSKGIESLRKCVERLEILFRHLFDFSDRGFPDIRFHGTCVFI